MFQMTLKQFQSLTPKKSRRFRSAFSTEQINYLEKAFKKFPYIGITYRKEIADTIKISEKAVKIWFQNRRMREKKDNGTNYLLDLPSKYNVALVKEQSNNHREQNGSINSIPQMNISNYSNGTNNDVINKNCQNKPQHFESTKNYKTDSNYDTFHSKSNQFANLSQGIKIKTRIPSTSSTVQVNKCAPRENQNITSKYLENKKRVHFSNHHIKDVPQDLSSKTKMAQKSMSSNQQYLPVNLNPEQKYIPMYNVCTTSMPIGAAVTTGIPIPTGTTLSRGKVIWKPMNSIQEPNITHIGMTRSNEIPFVTQNSTRSCNCNCHEASQCHPLTGFNQDPRVQPQYLLAIPLSTACNQM